MDFNLKIFFKNSSWFSKYCLVIINVDIIISKKNKMEHIYIREDLNLYGMINCNCLILNNCYHCIKELIPLLSGWFCSLNYIHALKKKCTVLLIDRNIGIMFFKPAQIIGWWDNTDFFLNGEIFIMECITDV